MAITALVLKKAANEKAVVEGCQGLCTLMHGRGRGKPVYMCACQCVHVGREIQHVPVCLCMCICVCAHMCTYMYLHGVCGVRFQKGKLRD